MHLIDRPGKGSYSRIDNCFFLDFLLLLYFLLPRNAIQAFNSGFIKHKRKYFLLEQLCHGLEFHSIWLHVIVRYILNIENESKIYFSKCIKRWYLPKNSWSECLVLSTIYEYQ